MGTQAGGQIGGGMAGTGNAGFSPAYFAPPWHMQGDATGMFRRQPNVSDLVGQTASMQPQIDAALNAPTGSNDAPNISDIVARVNQQQQTQQQIMQGPTQGMPQGMLGGIGNSIAQATGGGAMKRYGPGSNSK